MRLRPEPRTFEYFWGQRVTTAEALYRRRLRVCRPRRCECCCDYLNEAIASRRRRTRGLEYSSSEVRYGLLCHTGEPSFNADKYEAWAPQDDDYGVAAILFSWSMNVLKNTDYAAEPPKRAVIIRNSCLILGVRGG